MPFLFNEFSFFFKKRRVQKSRYNITKYTYSTFTFGMLLPVSSVCRSRRCFWVRRTPVLRLRNGCSEKWPLVIDGQSNESYSCPRRRGPRDQLVVSGLCHAACQRDDVGESLRKRQRHVAEFYSYLVIDVRSAYVIIGDGIA